jgi:ABC-type polysaccharide/polyol phosphate transport system ATPase subunit
MIQIDSLTKKYTIYPHKSDILKELFHPLRRIYHRDFWALDGVSCTIGRGETVGILGKNGAGKSTLLKIITGVLTPSGGSVKTEGSISSLLELGAGFNPEYSGIENIYLHGMITGFSKEEMNAKIPAILEFAEIGDFIHQKVKHYSSGMYARLAFAVAITVDPDILIVDEALSVGDMRFQQKCYRKFSELQNAGKTILFVTHDVMMVKNYCTRAIWISEGKIVEDGSVEEVCKHYIAQMSYDTAPAVSSTKELSGIEEKASELHRISTQFAESFGDRGAEITTVALYNRENGESHVGYRYGEWIRLEAEVVTYQRITSPGIGVIFKDRVGNQIFGIGNYIYDVHFDDMSEHSNYLIVIEFALPPIQNGEYSVTIALSEGTQENHIQHHWVHDITSIRVENDAIAYRIGNAVILPNESVILQSERIGGN